MWTREVLGTDIYHLLACFIIYSILGWFVESIYMSICNKKITNRGFTKSPFCPIYGFGAVIGTYILMPFAVNPIVLYLVSAVVATCFEFAVGKLMIYLFGELWWDYNEKRCNYKGIICLESTIAWGFYGMGIVYILNTVIMNFIDTFSMQTGILYIRVILFVVSLDFLFHLTKALGVDIQEYKERVVDKYQEFKTRWY